MRIIRTISYIARADFLERIRQYAFLVILGLTLLAAYFFVPAAEAAYVTLDLDGYRGIYNSAWIGGSLAISTTLLLSLLGFYLVKNSIERDETTGVGQIIASSSVKKLYYLFGKWISNFAVLSAITVAVMAASVIMQWVRGEERVIEWWPLVSPFLFLTLPFMSVVAALAVGFETTRILKGTLGNVLYFVLYLLFTAGSGVMPFGPELIISAMQKDLMAISPQSSGSYGMGILFPEKPLRLFEWQGVDWTWPLLSQQLSIVLAAFVLIAAASMLFHGFRETGHAIRKPKRAGTGLADADNTVFDLQKEIGHPVSGVYVSMLPPVVIRESFLTLIHAEWRLMMKDAATLRWLVIASVLFILGLAVPISVSAEWKIWPAVWIWPLRLWSGLGSRDARCGTQYLVASSPRYATRQLSAMWISGVMLTCITGGGLLLRMLLEGDCKHILYWTAAAFLIPSLALACGVLTGTGRTFELVYLIIWYLGPFSRMPYLNFLGTRNSETSAGNLLITNMVYLLISMGLLTAAYLSRRRLDQD
ncbi:Tat pathway signal protein [Paenibacillus sp. FSL R10-2736]|uniref:Tat pathway signal protein n=1 Tax=Paenibacillus sp. FSL R10-2736 TaxID=2954692 RepID=UPI0030F83145